MEIPLTQTGTIFNIQKFSLHDGPGIRTVVFLKGCPLRCKWCANPESQSAKIQILWDQYKCVNCGTCIRSCSQNAIAEIDHKITINSTLCCGCNSCVLNCPQKALKAVGQFKTVAEILKICLQDQYFYDESQGGVTLSGGEPLMQHELIITLLKSLKEHCIHTAIETTGFADFDTFARVLEFVDLVLFDIKHWDDKKHLEGTGVSNQLIIKNLKYAFDSGKKVLPRIPVIPRYNNSLKDAEHFVQRLKEVGTSEVQLLPFHQFGEKKYAMLGKAYIYKNHPVLHEEELMDFRQIFIDHGIHAFF